MKRNLALACLLVGTLFVGCTERPAPEKGDGRTLDAEKGAPGASIPKSGEAPRVAEAVRKDASRDASREEGRLERILPEDTLAFVTLDDISRAREELAETALAAIWREEEVQAFVQKPLAELGRVMRQVEEAGGFAFADIGKAFGGQVGAALVSIEPPARRHGDPGVVALLAARVTDGAAAGRLFDRVLGLVRSGPVGPGARDLTTAGWRGVSIQVAPEAQVTLALGKDFVLIAVAPPGSSAVSDFMSACAEPPEKSLATSDEFARVTGRLQAGRIATVFVSTDGLRQSILGAVRAHSARDAALAGQVVGSLGLDGVRSIGAAVAVDAPGIVQRTYCHAPKPRRGVLALVSDAEVSSDTLALAPEGALTFSAGSVGLSRVIGVLRDVMDVAGGGRDFRQALAEARRNLGFDLENDLLANLGDEAAFVIFPGDVSGGNPFLGGVAGISLVLTLKDAKAVEGVVDRLLGIADGAMRANEAGSVGEIEYLGTRIRYARVMGGMLAPSVAIVGDRLFITGGLHAAKELARLAGNNPDPFIKSDEAVAAFARIGGTKGVAVSYSDPEPAVLMGTAYTGMLAGMTLPALSSARERARRTKCLSNLKQITYACHLWAGDNDERFPPSLDALFPDYVSDRQLFSCPSSPARRSYNYVAGLTAADPPDWVLAYEPAGNHAGQGANAAYIGGQVVWTADVEGLQRQVAAQIARAKRRGHVVKVIEADTTGGMGPATMARGPGGRIDWGEFTDWVDLALLPPPRSCTRHLFPQVGRTVADDEGILNTTYGPVGSVGIPSVGGVGGVAVVAAIAIPNLLSSRTASNEAAAVAGCRAYLAAQGVFQRVDRYNRNMLVYANPKDGTGFPDLYRIGGPLDRPDGTELKLIDLAFARATGPESPKAGYYFVNLEYDDYSIDCGLCAVPAQYGKSGLSTFVIDLTGTVYKKDTGGRPVTRYPDVVQDGWLPVGM